MSRFFGDAGGRVSLEMQRLSKSLVHDIHMMSRYL